MPPEQAQETSIRDDFEASIAAIENEDESAITTETQADAEEQPITAEDLNSDDGQETPEAKAKEQVEAEAGKAIDKESAGDSAGDDADRDGSGNENDVHTDDKAPESWNPAAREGWADLPAAVKQQVAKRESEINKALNDGAEHRKTGAAFQGIADRYAQVFAAEGAPDAMTGVEELIKTVTTLRMGSAEQKAQKVAGFIKHYGIDIGTLDNMLTGQVSGKPAVDDPVSRMIEERLKPVDNLLAEFDQQKRAAQFQKNQDAINEVATFKQSVEFYDDVKNDMADMVELAEKRGVTMPLQEAYDKACALNPQVSEVLSKRLNDEKLINGGKVLDSKREASSSISGKQGGTPSTSTDSMSMRDLITAGFDAQVG